MGIRKHWSPQPRRKRERPPQTQEVKAPREPKPSMVARLIKPVGAAMLLCASLAHAQTTVSGPWGNAPANVPQWGAAAARLGQVIMGRPPYQAPNNGSGDGSNQFTQAMKASKVVTIGPGTYPVCNLAPQQNGQVLQGSGAGTILTHTTGCTNMFLVNSATTFITGFTIRN